MKIQHKILKFVKRKIASNLLPSCFKSTLWASLSRNSSIRLALVSILSKKV